MTLSSLRRSLAVLLVGSLILLSPGLAPYEALAGEIQGEVGAPAAPAAIGAANLPAFSLGDAAPAVTTLPGSAEVSAGLPAAAAPAAAASASAQAEVSADAKGVGEQLQALGEVSAASDGSARQAGESIQTVLSGRRLPVRDDAGFLPVSVEMAGIGGVATMDMGQYLAQPAGQESIGAPAHSLANAPRVPEPPAPPSGPQRPRDEGPRQQQPLIGRLASAAVALLPAALLGWPLIAAGSTVAGALVIASSVGLATLPFMSERTPAFLRGLPGVALGALGAATLYAGLAAAGWPTAVMGGLVLLGGWGFRRFAVDQKERGASDVLETLVGGLGAAAGAGLVLLSPAGWYFTALTIGSGAATLFLFAYLPGFVGAAMRAAADGLYYSAQDSVHVATSLSRDTTQYKRLSAWTEAHLKQSNWNALWLGLVWLVIGGLELGKAALGAVSGAIQGALRAVPMLAWGAAHDLSPDSRADRFMARWAKAAFAMQKARGFNRAEAPLLEMADSPNLFARGGAAVGITGLQLAWAVASLTITPFASLLGWIKSLTDPLPSSEKVVDPRYFRLDSDPLPAKVPEVAEPAVTKIGPVIARLAAAGIGAAPLKLMGLALWGAGFEGMAAVLAILAVAVMPLMPAGGWLPGWARRLPGWLMTGAAGLTLYFGVGAALAGLPTGWILPLAGLTALGGFGFSSMITTLRDESTKSWKVDSGWYIGGFGAALTLLSALGVSMLGLTGILPTALSIAAVVLSPLLLYHLGWPFWKGVEGAATAWFGSAREVYHVLTFADSDSRFGDNLHAWYRYWTRQSVWNGTIVLVPFLAEVVVRLGQLAVALAAGLAAWPFRAFPAFMLSRAQAKSWNSPQTRFWEGFQQRLRDWAEGSKKAAFDPMVAKLIPAMNEKNEVSSRPTLKAFFAAGLSIIPQALWLVGVAVALALTPLAMIGAYFAGAKARDQKPQ